MMVRNLRFKQFLIELRDHMIAQLNDALDRFALDGGSIGRVAIDGLPSLATVADARRLLEEGRTKASKILEMFRLS
jgi:hypothetical protein